MAQYLVTHVRFKDDALTHLKMGLWNPVAADWAPPPSEWPLNEVIDRILGADTIDTLLPSKSRHLVYGPNLRVSTQPGGRETLECITDERAGSELSAMPPF